MIFDFKKLAQQYNRQAAIVDKGITYSYQDLLYLAKSKRDQYQFNHTYVVLLARNDLEFVIEFIAVHLAKAIPIVLQKTDLNQVNEILAPITGQWQWIDTHSTMSSKEDSAIDLLFLGTTSGTTGVPKVYKRNWQSWQVGFDQCQTLFELDNYKGIMTTSPLGTSLGLHTIMLSLYMGKILYMFDRHRDQLIHTETMVFTVPTFMMPSYSDWADNRFVQGVVSCGGELTPKLVESWIKQHPQKSLYELFGSSETSAIAAQKIVQSKQSNHVGQLLPKVSVSITDEQLTVNSPYLFQGYLGDDKEPRFVQMDDNCQLINNELYVLGRKSDVINHGGNKIQPGEIESILSLIVKEVVVFGVPHTVYGEEIIAMIVSDKPIKVIKQFMQEKLPKYKQPQQYVKVLKIPLTPQKKISRAQLVERYRSGEWHA